MAGAQRGTALPPQKHHKENDLGPGTGHHQAAISSSDLERIHVLTYLDPGMVAPSGVGGIAGAAAFGGNRVQWDLLRTILAKPLVSATVHCPTRNVSRVEELLGSTERLRVAPMGAILGLDLAGDPHLVIHHFVQIFDPTDFHPRIRLVLADADDGAYGAEFRRQAELLGIGELVEVRADQSDASRRPGAGRSSAQHCHLRRAPGRAPARRAARKGRSWPT